MAGVETVASTSDTNVRIGGISPARPASASFFSRPSSREVSSDVCVAAFTGKETYLKGMYSGMTSIHSASRSTGRRRAGRRSGRGPRSGVTPIIGERRTRRSARGSFASSSASRA